jgi:hypothetical protein
MSMDRDHIIEEAAHLADEEERRQATEALEVHAPELGSLDQEAAGGVPAMAVVLPAGPGPRGSTASDQALGSLKAENATPALASPGGGGGKDKGKTSKGKASQYKPKHWTAKTIRALVLHYGASDVLERIASADSSPADIQAAHELMVTAGSWNTMIANLPQGANLGRNTRAALFRVIQAQAVDLVEAQQLFQLRFAHAAVNASANWSYDNLRLVWKQLDVLPDADVTRNMVLTTFNAITGADGFGPSWEAPATVNSIELGQQMAAGDIPHTVRHEVGHAVHTQIPGVVNAWLQSEMDVWFLTGDAAGVRSWIGAVGGFPKEYTDASGNLQPFGPTEEAQVVALVLSFLGGGNSWSPSRVTVDANQTALDQLLWQAMPETVQNAVRQSVPYWYSNWSKFQRGTGSRRYFLNYWYGGSGCPTDHAAMQMALV